MAIDLSPTQSGALSRLRRWLRRPDPAALEPDDSEWAPSPDQPAVRTVPARAPDPWPPPPLPPPPGWGAPPAGDASPPEASPARWPVSRRAVSAVVTAALLAAWVGFAFWAGPRSPGAKPPGSSAAAASPPPTAPAGGRNGGGYFRATQGSIVAVVGSTVTVSTTSGQSLTVVVSGSTTLTRSVAATLAQVTPGVTVTAVGTASPTGDALAATRLTVVPAGSPLPFGRGLGAGQFGVVTGVVTAASAGHITVTRTDGTAVKVLTAPGTSVFTTVAMTLPELAPGQQAIVRGSADSDGRIEATAIQVGGPNLGFGGGPGAPGAGTPPFRLAPSGPTL